MERRQHQRIQLGRHVEVSWSHLDRFEVDVIDYSMGGICLLSPVLMHPGDKLRFHSIITLEGDVRPLGMEGEVRHVQERMDEFSVGVSFI